jgi:O-acetyl-ADP-ribose deacetylase (regulator of RNase III)
MNPVQPKLEIIQGDITKVSVDVIVNAANSSLLGGGGVDGAIHRVGGQVIMEDCKKIIARQGGCKTGGAVITRAGYLPAKFVIHTVGPIWKDGRNSEAKKLANCYSNSLQLAVDNNCRIISFPNISTGIYGFPKREAAEIAVNTVILFLQESVIIEKVIFVCFEEDNFQFIQHLLQ